MCSPLEPTPEPDTAKRRRISIEEMQNELDVAGLCQPALSQLDHAVNGRACEVRKRFQELADEQVPVSWKRQKTSLQMPVGMNDSANMASISCGTSRLAVVPMPMNANLVSATTSAIVPYKQPLSWKHRIMFEPSESVFKAELAKEFRPVMTLPCGRSVVLAKAAVDIRGVVSLWSEDGELVASIPPIQKQGARQNNGVQIQLLGETDCTNGTTGYCATCTTYRDEQELSSVQYADGDCAWEHMKIEELEEFSPSTEVPDSDMDTD
jgi:hypothetical protein